jgi:hypothetical protein
MSEVQISAAINEHRTTMRSWAEREPLFSSALVRAKELEQVWWEAQASKNLGNREFNASLWLQCVKSRFRGEYGDRIVQEHVGKDGGPIQHERQAVDIIEGMLNTVASRLPSSGSSTDAPKPAPSDTKLH